MTSEDMQPSHVHAQPTASISARQVTINDFEKIRVIKKTSLGLMAVAKEKHTDVPYTIRTFNKAIIKDNDAIDEIHAEKRTFLAVAQDPHPFLLNLHSCFQTSESFYFVTEYVDGGSLLSHLERAPFSLSQSKFYTCEIVLALEHLHEKGIIHRNLSLDNLLLTDDGHVKMLDYTLCKSEMWYGSKTSTWCGTCEFMAPELLLEQRYGRSVDWWALGVAMYQMLNHESPFRGDDEDEIFDAILEQEPLYPGSLPAPAKDLVQQLLKRNPEGRIGCGPTDAKEVKEHPFFEDVVWDNVLNKRGPVPCIPHLATG